MSKGYLKSGQATDSDTYCEMLGKVQASVNDTQKMYHRKRTVLFQHDNARAHTTVVASWKLYQQWRFHLTDRNSPFRIQHIFLPTAFSTRLNVQFSRRCHLRDRYNSWVTIITNLVWLKRFYKLSNRWQNIEELIGDNYPH